MRRQNMSSLAQSMAAWSKPAFWQASLATHAAARHSRQSGAMAAQRALA